jgi:hypothetical protein
MGLLALLTGRGLDRVTAAAKAHETAESARSKQRHTVLTQPLDCVVQLQSNATDSCACC